MHEKHDDLHQLRQVLLQLVVFLGLRHLVFVVGGLTESDYADSVLMPHLARRTITTLCGWALIGSILVLRTRAFAGWNEIEHGTWLRWFATGLSLIPGLTFATQATNLYFGQEYLVDRIVVLLFVAGVYCRPILILPFTLSLIAFAGQFSIPIDGYGWDRHLLGVHRLEIHLLLVLFSGFLTKSNKQAVASNQSTILLAAVVIAACYWVPGLGKLRMGWVGVPTVQISFFGAWCHGWLAEISAQEVVQYTTHLRSFAIPMQCLVLLIECGAVFVLVRRVALMLLPMWAAFHIGAWLLYGFSFWGWITIDAAAFLYVWKCEARFRFGWRQITLACLLVGSSGFWLSPNRLAWFNAPFTNTFHVIATTAEGEQFEVHPSALAPYDYVFTMQQFGEIATEPQLVGPYGATTNRKTALSSGPELAGRQQRRSIVVKDSKLRDQLTGLLTRYATSWNAGLTNGSTFSLIEPPPLLNSTRPVAQVANRQIRSIKVQRRRSWLTGEKVVSEVAEVCLCIQIEPGRGASLP